jgi:hypothetical protein
VAAVSEEAFRVACTYCVKRLTYGLHQCFLRPGPAHSQQPLDPREELPEKATWHPVSNLPHRGSGRAKEESKFPAADLAEIARLCGLRTWVERSYKQVTHPRMEPVPGEEQLGDRCHQESWRFARFRSIGGLRSLDNRSVGRSG